MVEQWLNDGRSVIDMTEQTPARDVVDTCDYMVDTCDYMFDCLFV